MSLVSALLREDLRDFAGYRSARSDGLAGDVWLNANEAAHPNGADPDGALRRYPQPQPTRLCTTLAALYGCTTDALLVGRGSDEAIDLLVRAFCMPGRDGIVVTPPVFGMYAVCARLQGARVLEVPLIDGEGDFEVDLEQVAQVARTQRARLVFLCSPGNPAGGIVSTASVLALARQLEGSALVVVDEAYVEFSDGQSLVPCLSKQPNLAVLRTLSKAHALAGARIGCLIADPQVIVALRRCQAPYPIPVHSAQVAVQALSADALKCTAQSVHELRSERAQLADAIAGLACVRRVYPAQGNFLLVRFADAQTAFERLLDAGIVVRDVRRHPQLDDALRITIGGQAQNTRLIAVLRSLEAP